LAAGFAADHTILYYLIEMQRRATRSCNGAPMPEAPSLMPSESLRSLAARSASSGQPVAQIAAESGLSGIPYLAATAHGATPKQAFDALVSAQCSALMGQEFHYIGASAHNGQWTLIMAATEPQQVPVAPPAEGVIVQPAVPGLSGTPPAGAGQPAGQAQPTPPPAEAQNPAQLSGTDSNVAELRIPVNLSEHAPASPIAVREFVTDGRGRVLDSGTPLAPTPNTSGAGSTSAPGAVGAAGADPLLIRGPGPAHPPPGSAPKSARPGVVALEDTRPPEAVSDDGATILILQPDAQPGTPDTAPMEAIPPSAVSDNGSESAAPQPDAQVSMRNTAPVGTMPVRTTFSAAQAGPHETRMFGLINAARAQGRVCGGTSMPPATPLRSNSALDASAREHLRDMAARRYFSSTTPDGRNLGSRVTDGGYTWGLVAENLAAGRSIPDETLHKWLGNESQCRNLMDQEYEDIGIGFDPAGPFWSIILAAPLKEPELPTR